MSDENSGGDQPKNESHAHGHHGDHKDHKEGGHNKDHHGGDHHGHGNKEHHGGGGGDHHGHGHPHLAQPGTGPGGPFENMPHGHGPAVRHHGGDGDGDGDKNGGHERSEKHHKHDDNAGLALNRFKTYSV